LLLISSSLFSPTSATRYIFDFIYVFSIAGFVFLCSLTYSIPSNLRKTITLITLTPLIIITLFFSISLYLRGIQEYHYQSYLNINNFLYHLIKNPSVVDSSYYINLGLVSNNTNYFVINDRVTGTFGVNVSPLDITTPKYTQIQDKSVTFRFTSFEKKQINVKLSFTTNFETNPIGKDILYITYNNETNPYDIQDKTIISIPVTFKPGFNEIQFESENIKNKSLTHPTKLSHFQLSL
jgi:hypothetical protein